MIALARGVFEGGCYNRLVFARRDDPMIPA
jgi:hypothetical protein